MPFDHTVHHTVKTREGSMPGRVTPYIMLGGPEGATVLLQNGQFHRSDGVPFDDENEIPDWAWNAAFDLTNEAREEVGFPALAEKEKVKPAGAGVDIMGARRGNTPMQLNADDAEGDGKASPVPQDAAGQGATPPKTPPLPTKAPVTTGKK